MITLGITGNIGSGKSLAANCLRELGAEVIDADQVGHRIILRGGKAYQPLIDAFGDSVLAPDGEIDRRALGEYVFSDSSGKRRAILNSITHPLIREEIQEQINAYAKDGYPVAVVEAALMFEGEFSGLLNKIWLISAPRGELIERVKSRDRFDEATVEARLNSQMPEAQMAGRADAVIVNDGTVERFRQRIKKEYDKLLKESS